MTSEAIKLELTWWIDNIGSSFCTISHSNPEMTIYTDASLLGCRAVCDNLSTQRKFLPEELHKYEGNINALELLAVKYGLHCFSDVIEGKHILIKCDNTTEISYVTNMGGTHCYTFVMKLPERYGYGVYYTMYGFQSHMCLGKAIAQLISSLDLQSGILQTHNVTSSQMA